MNTLNNSHKEYIANPQSAGKTVDPLKPRQLLYSFPLWICPLHNPEPSSDDKCLVIFVVQQMSQLLKSPMNTQLCSFKYLKSLPWNFPLWPSFSSGALNGYPSSAYLIFLFAPFYTFTLQTTLRRLLKRLSYPFWTFSQDISLPRTFLSDFLSSKNYLLTK